MLVFNNLFAAIGTVLQLALTFYMWVIIARAILSWVSPDPYNPIVRFIHNITEPVLRPIRSKIPSSFGGVDLSPLIVILGIIFLQKFIVGTLFGMANSFH